MNPLLLEILPLVRQGYCCSQLLMLLALGQRGEDHSAPQNSALVQAMRGLCHGIGQSDGPCGLLAGGACVLALLAGQDEHSGGQDEQQLIPLLNDYAEWFYARTNAYGGYGCTPVSSGLAREAGQALAPDARASASPDPLLCGNLLAECWDKIVTLCADYKVDTGL